MPLPRLTALVRDVARCSRGHDLLLYSAGVTFYAAIGVVPLLLLSVFLAGLVVGPDPVRVMAEQLAALLPRNLGAEDAARRLAGAGGQLEMTEALAAFVPASLYGEGLVRAFDRLSIGGERGRRSLRGRIGSLVLVVVNPVLLLAGLGATHGLTSALGTGTGARLLGVYLAFLVGWLSISVLLLLAYRGLAPERPGRRALAWGALGTASVLSGTSLGYVLFLGIDLPLGSAFGGSQMLAAVAVSGLWLYFLHAVVLVGYLTTLRLAARDGHPLGPVVREGRVRAAHPAEHSGRVPGRDAEGVGSSRDPAAA